VYVDSTLLLIIYILAASAALISVYALWTLKEVVEQLRKKNSKPNNAWDHYHTQAKEKPKSNAKGHWD
jgi:ABC-type nickel/cobalt efflux system permease component RcnA